MKLFAIVISVLGLTSAASASVITVDDSGGADYITIGEALAAAASGDMVLVKDGTYAGANNRQMDFGGKNIVLVSENGAATTIIDCQNISYAFYITAGVDSTAMIRGFTITNSNGEISGGGIWLIESSPKILDCVFSHCANASNGAAIQLRRTPPMLVRGCTFFSNAAINRGGAVHADDSAVTIEDCVFYDNAVSTTDPHYSFGGGAIQLSCYPESVVVRGCSFVGNSCANTGGSTIHHVDGGAVLIENCIFAAGVGRTPVSGECSVSNSVVFGNVGSEGDSLSCSHHDNLFVNPLFCDAPSDDYTLCSDSPCLPGSPANPWGEHVGALGVGCGDCGSAVEQATWGAIKALYLR